MADTNHTRRPAAKAKGRKNPGTRYRRPPEGSNDNIEYVRWWPDDGRPSWPPIQRRSDDDIRRECQKCWDKVWWNQHMFQDRNPGIADDVQSGRANARAIEKRWGKEFLDRGSDFEWGRVFGFMQALSWVLGVDWEPADEEDT